MNIWVQSCGSGPEQGYCWAPLSNPNSQENQVVQPILNRLAVSQLIEHERFSVGVEWVLQQNEKRLALIITGLATNERADYQNRQVTHSLLCIANNSQEEICIRGMVVAALRGNLARQLDNAISFDTTPTDIGFTVSADLYETLRAIQAQDNQPCTSQAQQCRIGKNSTTLQQELAEELDTYTFPNRKGMLIVVTGIVDPQKLKKAKVWRALTNLFNGSDTTWTPYTPPSSSSSSQQPPVRTGMIMPRRNKNMRGANLQGANLHHADLRGADLRGANLRNANLYGANLRGAKVYGATFNGANLSYADLRWVAYWYNEFRGARYDHTKWPLFLRPPGVVQG